MEPEGFQLCRPARSRWAHHQLPGRLEECFENGPILLFILSQLAGTFPLPFVFLLLWLHKDKKGRRNMNNTHLALSLIILAVHLAGVTDGAGLHVYAAFYLPLYQQREESEASLN